MTNVEGDFSLVGRTPWSFGQGLHWRLPAWRQSCSRPDQTIKERKKPRNHTAATGQAAYSLAISFKRVFSRRVLAQFVPVQFVVMAPVQLVSSLQSHGLGNRGVMRVTARVRDGWTAVWRHSADA